MGRRWIGAYYDEIKEWSIQMIIGDMVQWKLGDTIADALGHSRSKITGIVTGFRKKPVINDPRTSTKYTANYIAKKGYSKCLAMRLEVEVLCKSGNVTWYPDNELRIIIRKGMLG